MQSSSSGIQLHFQQNAKSRARSNIRFMLITESVWSPEDTATATRGRQQRQFPTPKALVQSTKASLSGAQRCIDTKLLYSYLVDINYALS